jgi:hypothetical protein
MRQEIRKILVTNFTDMSVDIKKVLNEYIRLDDELKAINKQTLALR